MKALKNFFVKTLSKIKSGEKTNLVDIIKDYNETKRQKFLKKIHWGIFLIFLKVFRKGECSLKISKSKKQEKKLGLFHHLIDLSLEIFYKKITIQRNKKKQSLFLENYSSFFFFLNFQNPPFLNENKTTNRKIKPLFSSLFYFDFLIINQKKNKPIQKFFDTKLLQIKENPKKKFDFSSNYILLFLRSIKKFFLFSCTELNRKRFLALGVFKTGWKLFFWREVVPLESLFQGYNKKMGLSENYPKRKNHKSCLSARIFRVMIQKTTEFFRDVSPMVRKNAKELLFFILFKLEKFSCEQNYLLKKLFSKINEKKIFLRKGLLNYSNEAEEKKRIMKKKVSEKNFFFQKKEIFNSFFSKKGILSYNKEKKKKNKQNLFFQIEANFYFLGNFFIGENFQTLFSSFLEKHDILSLFNFSEKNFFIFSLEAAIKNEILFPVKKNNFINTLPGWVLVENSIKTSHLIEIWVSLLVNCSPPQIKTLNSIFLETVKKKMNLPFITRGLKKERDKELSKGKRFQKNCIFAISSTFSKVFFLRENCLMKEEFKSANKSLITDGSLLILWIETYIITPSIFKKIFRTDNKISKNHGVLLNASRSFSSSLKKGFYPNLLFKKKLIIFIWKFSFNPIKNFTNLLEKEKTGSDMKEKTLKLELLKIFIWLQPQEHPWGHEKTCIFSEKLKKSFKKKKGPALKFDFLIESSSPVEENIYEDRIEEFLDIILKTLKKDVFLKFFFLDFLKEAGKKNGQCLKGLEFLLRFYCQIESEKRIRSKIIGQANQGNSLDLLKPPISDPQFSKIFFQDESSFLIKREMVLLRHQLEFEEVWGKKFSYQLKIISRKKNFSIFILNHKLDSLSLEKKIQKKKTQYLDFIFHFFCKKEIKEKGLVKFLRKLREIDSSLIMRKKWGSKVIFFLNKASSDTEQKKMILFYSWIITLNKELEDFRDSISHQNLFINNLLFFNDKITLLLGKKPS